MSSLVTLLIESFLPEAHQKYLYLNYSQSSQYRTYKSFVPDYLSGRPHSVISHCLNRKTKALKYSSDDVTLVNEQLGIFEVKGSKDKTHVTKFGLQSKDHMPQCTCLDWTQWHLPCKHFFAIFRLYPQWNWNSLSQEYLQGPYLTIDNKSLNNHFGDDTSVSVQTLDAGDDNTAQETSVVSDIPRHKV